MAGYPKTLTPKQQAILDIARVRASLVQHWRDAANELHPGILIRQSVRKHRAAWAFGALITGFLAISMLIPSVKKNERDSLSKSAKKSGIIALVAAPFAGLARKAVLSFLTTQVQQFVQNSVKNARPS